MLKPKINVRLKHVAQDRIRLVEICAGHTVFHFRNRYRCKDASYRWLSWSATPSPSTGLIYGSAKDITKIVRMEQNLTDSNARLTTEAGRHDAESKRAADKHQSLADLDQFKDEVTTMLVHDLRNPLSVIVSNYDFVVEGFEGSADCLEALNDSQLAGHRMLRLLTNLADVRRFERGSLPVKLSSILLSTLLTPLVDQRRMLSRERGVSVSLMPLDDLTVECDVDLLTRTLENILDNALRHTPSHGRIELSTRQVEACVEIRIGNTGEAIPESFRERIFEKYRQGSQSHGRLNLGLGLYFSRLATKAQGGDVWVEESQRLPATFCIRLPSARTKLTRVEMGALGESALVRLR